MVATTTSAKKTTKKISPMLRKPRSNAFKPLRSPRHQRICSRNPSAATMLLALPFLPRPSRYAPRRHLLQGGRKVGEIEAREAGETEGRQRGESRIRKTMRGRGIWRLGSIANHSNSTRRLSHRRRTST
ncbi:hypothetical protein P280DRAFT_177940 [Massarina eburnea CBS 473.64]|uniref:Uncharacterized protein n=1 Tax=Massarina eburnea CBS 473.64 TaxID=1395130 RepID=A0A6A6S9Y7_9PLEO|nr:hypothetical protein P280DRAFT_177940 [Massarina eburnea CBS 473.64]